MKTITMFALIMFAVSTAYAGDLTKAKCRQVAALARDIMTDRQAGMPIFDVSAIHNPNENDAIENLVLYAFKISFYNTEKYKQKKIREFEAKIYIKCMEQTNGK